MTRLAVCPGCSRPVAFRHGQVRPHHPPGAWKGRCPGSGQPVSAWRTTTFGGRDVLVPPGRTT